MHFVTYKVIIVEKGMFSLYNNFDQSFRDNIGCSAINIARWALSVPGTGIISLVKVITQIFSAHSGEFGYQFAN